MSEKKVLLVAVTILLLAGFLSEIGQGDVSGGWFEPFSVPILQNICNIADGSDAHPSVLLGAQIYVYYVNSTTNSCTGSPGTAIWLAKFQPVEGGLQLVSGYPKRLSVPNATGLYPTHPEALMLPNGKIRLYYAIWDLTNIGWFGIKAADSVDGVSGWVDKSTLACGSATCVYSSPNPVSDQAYSMYVAFTQVSLYEAWISQAGKIMYGTSTDGIVWNVNPTPSIPQSASFWKFLVTKRPDLLSIFRYDAWFSMTLNNQGWPDIGIGHAYSYNGYDWQLDSDNPILSIYDSPPTWRKDRTGTPSVVWIGQFDQNFEFAMFFGGMNSGLDPQSIQDDRFAINIALYPKANAVSTFTETTTNTVTTNVTSTRLTTSTSTVSTTTTSATTVTMTNTATLSTTVQVTATETIATTDVTHTLTSTTRTTITNASTTLTGSTTKTLTYTTTTTTISVSSRFATETFVTQAYSTTIQSITEPPWIWLIIVGIAIIIIGIIAYFVVNLALEARRRHETEIRALSPTGPPTPP